MNRQLYDKGGIITLDQAKEMAPPGESLAYINPEEAALLKSLGGAGEDVNGTGIKSYFFKKIFKKAKNAVKKVIKSPIGKIGLGAALLGGMGGFGGGGLGKLLGGIKNMGLGKQLGLIGGGNVDGGMGGGGAGISSTMKLGLIPFKRETTTLSFWLKKREKVWITTFNGGIGNTFYIPYLSPSMWTWRGGVNEVQNYNKVETMIQDMKLPFKIEEGKIRICHVFMQQDNPAATVAGLPQTHTVLPGAIRIIKDTEGLINESHKICKATGKDYPTTKEQYTMNIGESLPRICQNTSDPPDNGILGTNKNLIFRRAGHIEEVTPDEEWTHSVKFGRTGGHYYKSSEWQQIRGPGNAEGVYLDMDYALQGENNTTLGGNDYNKDITNRQYGGYREPHVSVRDESSHR